MDSWKNRRVGLIEPSRDTFVDPATASILNSQMRRGLIPMDLIHLIVTGVVSLFFAGLFIVLPLMKSDVRQASGTVRYASLLYFSSLGAGFILFELVFVQVFMKLVGYPVHTYALVIFTLLFGAGIGSTLSRPLGISPAARWSWPFVGIVLYGAVLAVSYPFVFDRFLAASDGVRMAVAAALILPLAFCLGVPFPLGILLAEQQPRGAVAWAWGLNGLFTVIGSLASVLLGLTIGFQATILVAVAIYMGAFLAFAVLRAAVMGVHQRSAYKELTYVEEAT